MPRLTSISPGRWPLGASGADGLFSVEVALGGVDDDIASFSLATGDARLEPEMSSAVGRCAEITVAERRCRIDFDVTAAEGSNRVLVLRRGDEQVNWVLATP